MTPRGALGGRQLRDHVVGAANLERAGRLQAFGLEEEGPSRRSGDVDERRHACEWFDTFGGGADLVEGDLTGGGSCLCHGPMAVCRLR